MDSWLVLVLMYFIFLSVNCYRILQTENSQIITINSLYIIGLASENTIWYLLMCLINLYSLSVHTRDLITLNAQEQLMMLKRISPRTCLHRVVVLRFQPLLFGYRLLLQPA